MWDDLDVTVDKVPAGGLKTKPADDALGFGAHFTDHMFLMRWSRRKGWHDATICPYGDFRLDPAAMVFHYGQAIFEGLKAYRGKDDQVYLFRPEDNFSRMNSSARRLCMPQLPGKKMVSYLKALIYLERDWVPRAEGATLYIRPTMIATEPGLGVRPSGEYIFFIILSPVGAYYAEGFNPTRIYVSDTYARAVKGGVGEAKAAGNYAASLYTSEIAKKAECTQVLWLDACEHRYIEEVGTSNIFFLIGEQLVTPSLEGSILSGLTRDSVIKLAESWGIEVVQRKVSIDEVLAANEAGTLREIFGTGTAAVISPVGELLYKDRSHPVNNGRTGELAARLFTELQAIQNGYQDDPFAWVVTVC